MGKPTFNTKVINFLAGPGAGKSTMSAGLFAELKWNGIECELAPEYAKDLLWEGRLGRTHPYDILMGQYQRLWRLKGKVQYIITDSPLILPGIYNPDVLPLAEQLWGEFDNINYYVDRVKPYSPVGRRESEQSARGVDKKVLDYLITYESGKQWQIVEGSRHGIMTIANNIMRRELN